MRKCSSGTGHSPSTSPPPVEYETTATEGAQAAPFRERLWLGSVCLPPHALFAVVENVSLWFTFFSLSFGIVFCCTQHFTGSVVAALATASTKTVAAMVHSSVWAKLRRTRRQRDAGPSSDDSVGRTVFPPNVDCCLSTQVSQSEPDVFLSGSNSFGKGTVVSKSTRALTSGDNAHFIIDPNDQFARDDPDECLP